MPSADQVPTNTSHSRMPWHMWVVLIAGSTGSALRAVRPPNLHIMPVVRRDFVYAQARRREKAGRGTPRIPRSGFSRASTSVLKSDEREAKVGFMLRETLDYFCATRGPF